MIGTVKSVSKANDGTCSAVINRTTPPPAEEVPLPDIEPWVHEELRAALIGGVPVTITQDEGGTVLVVKIG